MVAALAVEILAGCSLLTVEFPDDPLSEVEINARVATHRFAQHFGRTVGLTADDIAARSDGGSASLAALRWKIGASSSVTTGST